MRPIVERAERLQRLAAFDAAARLGSFTAAAVELGSTQPAVTRQIRALERSLGLELFERTANRSHLTEAGRQFATAVDAGFMTIEQTLTSVTEQASTFVLASPPGFAQHMMVPVLDELHAALASEHEYDIRLWLYDRDTELERGDADAMVRIGTGDWPGLDAVRLFAEAVVPVATRACADEHGLHTHSAAADVLAAPLLHMDATDRPWMSWSDWLAEFGLSLPPRRRCPLQRLPGGGAAGARRPRRCPRMARCDRPVHRRRAARHRGARGDDRPLLLPGLADRTTNARRRCRHPLDDTGALTGRPCEAEAVATPQPSVRSAR